MLLREMPLKVVRSRKRLATVWNETSEGTFPMNSSDMAAEIFLQCKSLRRCAASDSTLEGALVGLGVFSTDWISIKFGDS